MPTCRSCDIEVLFVKSAVSGKFMCLEAAPTKEGNVVIVQTGVDRIARVVRVDEFPRFPVRYIDHHARCPKAAEHRRKP